MSRQDGSSSSCSYLIFLFLAAPVCYTLLPHISQGVSSTASAGQSSSRPLAAGTDLLHSAIMIDVDLAIQDEQAGHT